MTVSRVLASFFLQALRRTMELFSSTTRFALSCNNSSKVIEPIQSRCAILRYTRLSDVQLVERLQHVIAAENIVAWTKEGLEALVFTAEGDMRQVRALWDLLCVICPRFPCSVYL